MKYLSKFEEVPGYGKRYIPTTPEETLYALQPPPETTEEGELKQLIHRIFLGVRGNYTGRNGGYYFDVHQCLEFHEVTKTQKEELLRLVPVVIEWWGTEKRFIKGKSEITISLEEVIMKLIKSYEPRPKREGIFRSNVKEKEIEFILENLKERFPIRQREHIEALLKHGTSSPVSLVFQGTMFELTCIFRKEIEEKRLLFDSKKELAEWISQNFQSSKNGGTKATTKTIVKYLSDIKYKWETPPLE